MKNTPDTDVICERLDNLIKTNKEEHGRIIEQTTKTNGSVKEIQKWKERINGGFIVSNAIIIPILITLILDKIL